MKLTYNMRADGRLYRTTHFKGPSDTNIVGGVEYFTTEEVPQVHATKIYMLMAGCNNLPLFILDGVGKTGTSRQIFVDGYDTNGGAILAIEDTRQFELWFDEKEGSDDKDRNAGVGGSARPTQYF